MMNDEAPADRAERDSVTPDGPPTPGDQTITPPGEATPPAEKAVARPVRRRRKATTTKKTEGEASLPLVEAAPSTDVPPSAEAASVEQPEPSAPAAEEPPAAPKKRRTTRKRTTKVKAVETAQPVAEPSVPSEPAAAPVEAVAAEGVSSEAAPVLAETAPAPAETPSAPTEAAATTTEVAPTPKKRRAPRRKAAAKAEPAPAPSVEEPISATAEAPAEPMVVAEAVAAPVAEVEKKPEAKPKPTRSRSRKSKRVAAEAPAAETAAVTKESVAEAPTKPERPSRRRAKREEGQADLTVGARVAVRKGCPEIQVRGESIPPVLFFGSTDEQANLQTATSEIHRAAQAGVRLFSTLAELPCPLAPEDRAYDAMDARIQAIIDACPTAYVIPRIVFVPAPGWQKQYPDEVNHYIDGTTDDPSIASDRFWSEAVESIRSMVEHIDRTTFGTRVVGYHLERGEWFHSVDSGYDRSFANREAFRQWLRTKYKNSEVALRAAWRDSAVQFYTAEIPELPTNPAPERAFFEPRRERQWIDFLEYTSECTADRLVTLAKAVKEATQEHALVSVCYGYTYEFGHTFSGHLALGKLLSSNSIDIVSGPPSYRERQAGKSGAAPSPVDSFTVHGKLWISEDDTKTYLAPAGADADDYNPRIETREATQQVHLRAIGQSLARQTGIGWMDLWGDGWLDADGIWETLGGFQTVYKGLMKNRKATSPEVVILVDERSLTHVQKGEAFVRRLLSDQRDAALRCGASVGFYLQTDVSARTFPIDAKLYVFLNPYRVTAEQRTAIRSRLQNGNKTVVWMYAAGVCDDRGEADDSAMEIVGISVRQQPWNSEVGSRITDTRHPITEQLQAKTIGIRERLNPSFYVDDDAPNVTVLAEYAQTGHPSIAVRQYNSWRSVFCGEPTLTAELLRGLCHYAGVHLYTANADDFVYAGNGWATIHSTKDGPKSISLPSGCSLYDLVEQKVVADDLSEYRFSMRARTTRVFYVGPRDEMVRQGLPGVEKTRGRKKASETLVAEEPPVPEPELSSEANGDLIEAEGLTQLLQESIADAVTDDAEDQAIAEDATPPTHRKRRRRRGGRGRGRRHAGPSEASGSNNGTPPPAG